MLCASSYEVEATECYKVPSNIVQPTTYKHVPNFEDLDNDLTKNIPCPPDVPTKKALQEDQSVGILDTPTIHKQADNILQPPITHPPVSELDNIA